MSKVWFVTGSSHGLGRSFVEAALSRGDQVAATARNVGRLDDLVDTYGDAVLPLRLDVTDKAAAFESIQRTKDHFGRIDVVVNNAARGVFGAVEELTEEQLRDQTEATLFGAVWVTQAALPHMREQGSGHVIQISSISGVAAYPLAGAYTAAKMALEGLSDSLAQEVAGFGIKVTLVEPGSFATESTGGVYAEANPAYDDVRESLAAFMGTRDVGEPAAAGRALLKIADADNPPLRVFFGPEGYQTIQQVYADRLQTWADWQDLSIEAHGNLDQGAADRPAERFRVFTDNELEYLHGHPIGRLATVGNEGEASVRPLTFKYDPEWDAVVIAGSDGMAKSKKFRDARDRPRVSLVVDDLASTDPWTPRGIEIRGHAETFLSGGRELGERMGSRYPYDEAWIRIRPTRILSWGIEPGSGTVRARDV